MLPGGFLLDPLAFWPVLPAGLFFGWSGFTANSLQGVASIGRFALLGLVAVLVIAIVPSTTRSIAIPQHPGSISNKSACLRKLAYVFKTG